MTARLPTVGGDNDTWGNILNTYLDVAHNADGTLQTSAIQSAGGVTSVNSKTPTNGAVTLTAGDVSAISQSAADSRYVQQTSLGAASGVATLNGSSQLTNSQVPSAVVNAASASANSLPFANGSGGYAWSGSGINSQAANYTFALNDGAGEIVASSSSSSQAFTIPPHSSVAFAVPTTLVSEQHGTGKLSVVPGAGVTLYFRGASVSSIAANSQYGTVVVTQVANDVWVGVASGNTCRVVTVTQSATPAINTDITEVASITGLAQAITSMSSGLTGTPHPGDTLVVELTDNGTGRAITWGASFASTTVALPTTTLAGTLLQVMFRRDAGNSVWRCVLVA